MTEGGFTDLPSVDPRYTLANERTLLAWARTALAFIAAGLAVIQFFDRFELPGGRRLLGLGLIVLGSVMAALAGRQWQARETAMKAGQAIPPSRLGWLVAGGVVVTGVVAVVFAAVGLAAS